MQNPIITVVYSHGRHGSASYGSKIEALRPVALRLGVNVISIRYPEDVPINEMEARLLLLAKDDVSIPGDLVFLSSSRGAYISTRVSQAVVDYFAAEPSRVEHDKTLPRRNVLGHFMIAPALYINPEQYADQDPTPATVRTSIVHGLDDDVVDCANIVKFARKFKSQVHLLEGGHRLHSQRDTLCALFEMFLRGCIAQSQNTFKVWAERNGQTTQAV